MNLPFFKVEYIKIPVQNFSDYFTTMTLSYWKHNIEKLEWVYYLNERKYFKDAYCPCKFKTLKYIETK